MKDLGKNSTTHHDDGFSQRIDRIKNLLTYEVALQDFPLDSNPYEIIGAKLLLKWGANANRI